MYNIYQLYSTELNLIVFIGTKNIDNLIKHCNNYNIIKILNTKYILQLVFLNIQKNKINELIDTVKNDKTYLTSCILKCKNQLASLDRKRIGDANEIELKPVIENVFNMSLIKTDYEYSVFDFYSENCLVELKSLLHIHHNVFVGINKMICKNLLFIFKCNYTKDLYYLQYDPIFFDSIDVIETPMNGRLQLKRSYSISKKYLTKFNKNDKISLSFLHDEREAIKKLLDAGNIKTL